MAKHAGAFRSEKRRKELSRLKKQEEKRKRRLNKKVGSQQDIEMTDTEGKDREQEN
ncbi:MAG: hypothetical protein OEW69_05005 [Nitrospirota bacterium]|nr:hypothetical protein [Nitrospirota bacterium]